MITVENYYKEFAKLDVSTLPDNLKTGHEYIDEFTDKGTNWSRFDDDPEAKKLLAKIFKRFEEYIAKNPAPVKYPEWTQGKGLMLKDTAALEAIYKLYLAEDYHGAMSIAMSSETEVREAIPPDIWLKLGGQLTTTGYERLKKLQAQQKRDKSKEEKPQAIVQAKSHEPVNPDKKHKKVDNSSKVEHFPEEFRFIRRFINMQGKTKTREQLLNFIIALQRSITEKRISKDSPFKKQIDFIQDALVRNYNNMRRSIPVEIPEKNLLEFKSILGDKVIYPTVKFIKQFVFIQGKLHMKERAKRLYNAIKNALDKDLITVKDKYFDKLNSVKGKLKSFISSGAEKKIEVESAELNGLNGILGCPCEEKEEKREVKQEVPLSGTSYGGRSPQIMNSMEFVNLHFEKLGFKGKWKDFIGDPSRGFTMGVFALPKMGKSTLCIEFAGYLARNHGTVLYVAREEGLDATLQNKLNATDVKHPNLTVSSFLPEDISIYDFIFLDSVNKLDLSPEDLESLKKKFPAQSFIFIFQSTKDGKIRGKNEYLHDVDIIVEIPELGRAVQNGRFNQGGEMNVFENLIEQ
jgi:hypothetical protein